MSGKPNFSSLCQTASKLSRKNHQEAVVAPTSPHPPPRPGSRESCLTKSELSKKKLYVHNALALNGRPSCSITVLNKTFVNKKWVISIRKSCDIPNSTFERMYTYCISKQIKMLVDHRKSKRKRKYEIWKDIQCCLELRANVKSCQGGLFWSTMY